MRVVVLAMLACAASGLATPVAYGCSYVTPPPPPPKIFWPEPPSTIGSGEVVLQIEFSRYAFKHPLDKDNDDIIVVDCGPTPVMYRVIKVLAGDPPLSEEVVIYGRFALEPKGHIIVGRLTPFPAIEAGFRLATGDADLPAFKPSLPPS